MTTVRSVCIISREFPPDTAYGGIARLAHMQATAFARAGLSVHVLTLDPTGVGRVVLEDGFVVHRVASSPAPVPPEMPYVAAGLWSTTLAEAFRRLDVEVGFDVVQAQDYYAEPLHLELRPETPLVTYLNAPSLVVSEQFGRIRTPGELALELLEGAALRRADLLLAPTELVLSETRRLHGEGLPEAIVCPHQVELDRFRFDVREPRQPGSPLRAVFIGRLEPLKGPAHALRAVAAARGRGLDVTLTLVGRDCLQPDVGSYRRNVLLPLMRELGLGFDTVRFVEQVNESGVAQHLRHADIALLPSVFENFHTAAVEALAAGVPVICGARSGLQTWVTPENGLRPADNTDPERFAAQAADALADETWLRAAAERGPVRVREAFDPTAVTEQQLEIYEALVAARRLPSTPDRADDVTGPRLGVVVLAHNQLSYTQRCVRSLLANTSLPLRIVVVDNASTDGTAEWVASLGAPVELVSLPENRGVSGGRNAGISALGDDVELIAFLDNDVEVTRDWWRPFATVLDAFPEVGIAGERGVVLHFSGTGRREEPLYGAGPRACDMAIGFCMVMRAEAVHQIGLFDENLGLFWHDDDDYGLRAGRLGWGVIHVGSGRVHHFEHRSSELVEGIWAAKETPTELSKRNQRYLAEKWARLTSAGVEGTRSAVVLAFAEELVSDPALGAAFADRFTGDDDVTLVLLGVGWNAERIEAELIPALATCGLDGDGAPDLLALTPGAGEELTAVAQSIDAVLSSRAPAGVFHAPAHFGGDRVDQLAALVERRLGVIRGHASRAA
ncbi:MAG: glycosyltransferase [Gaiellales bacterium]